MGRLFSAIKVMEVHCTKIWQYSIVIDGMDSNLGPLYASAVWCATHVTIRYCLRLALIHAALFFHFVDNFFYVITRLASKDKL